MMAGADVIMPVPRADAIAGHAGGMATGHPPGMDQRIGVCA
jgi:hypothetical protein